MCGIFGANRCEAGEADVCASGIKYRGPDYTGAFSDDSIALVHHRLAVIDLDARSNQPLASRDGRYRILFNGEIYNFRELRDELERLGETFRTASDTEVVLVAYVRFGAAMTQKLRGMYVIVIHDAVERRLHLFRDHAGIKPLYLLSASGAIAFGSELKPIFAFAASRNIGLPLSQDGLALFWQFGYIPSPWTSFSNIRRLRPGTVTTIALDTAEISESHTKPFRSPEITDERSFTKLIEQRILDHLIADVPVGLFFSGGTDSSVLAMILKRHNVKLRSYSVVVEGKSADERFIRDVGERLNLEPFVLRFGTAEAEAAYAAVLERIDEPIADGSLFPTYAISVRAADDVKVVLSGEGGDEMFGGYGRFGMLSVNAGRSDDTVSLLDRAYCALGPRRGSRSLFKRAASLLRKPASYYFADTGLIENTRAFGLMKKLYRDEGIGPLRYDARTYLEGDLLRKIDLATSYASIEGRVPLLDYDIVANAPRFAAQMVEGGVHKAILKRMLGEELPRELIYRPKSGFGVPFGRMVAGSRRIADDVTRAVRTLDAEGLLPLPKSRFIGAARRNHNLLLAAVMLETSLRRSGHL